MTGKAREEEGIHYIHPGSKLIIFSPGHVPQMPPEVAMG